MSYEIQEDTNRLREVENKEAEKGERESVIKGKGIGDKRNEEVVKGKYKYKSENKPDKDKPAPEFSSSTSASTSTDSQQHSIEMPSVLGPSVAIKKQIGTIEKRMPEGKLGFELENERNELQKRVKALLAPSTPQPVHLDNTVESIEDQSKEYLKKISMLENLVETRSNAMQQLLTATEQLKREKERVDADAAALLREKKKAEVALKVAENDKVESVAALSRVTAKYLVDVEQQKNKLEREFFLLRETVGTAPVLVPITSSTPSKESTTQSPKKNKDKFMKTVLTQY